MEYTLEQLTQSAAEVVPLALVKRHLCVDHDDDDALITLKVNAAREYAEEHTGRVFGVRTFRLHLYSWPVDGYVYFPVEPLVSVESVNYLDTDGAAQVVDSGLWRFWKTYSPPTLYLTPAFGFPSTDIDEPAAISIDFTAGDATIPARLQEAILILVEYWRKAPGGDSSSPTDLGIPSAVRRILDNLWTGAL